MGKQNIVTILTMMKPIIILATLLCSTTAFAPTQNVGHKASTELNAGKKSAALPFLPYPENLAGYIGDDIGFDPLRISDYFPMDYLREAELKHSRICMLAITGYITVDLGFIVHPYGVGLSSAAAHDVLVEKGVMGNMFGFVTWYLEGKTEEEVKTVKYQEIMNGRLAMMAFGGVATQSILFDVGFPYIGPISS